MQRFAANPRRVLVVHAKYDLTFLPEFSLDVIANFDRYNIDYVSKVLPCGHYTTGETPSTVPQVHRRLVPRLVHLQVVQEARRRRLT